SEVTTAVIVLLVIAGLIVGGIVGDGGGALGGAALGLGLGFYITLKRRIDELEQEIEVLRRQRWSEAPPPEPRAPKPEPGPEPRLEPSPETTPGIPPLSAAAAAAAAANVDAPAPATASRGFETVIPRPLETDATSAGERSFERPWQPSVPELRDSAPVRWVRDYFMNGNLVVRVGIIVLFFGVAFLLKFAADRHLLPVELRLAGVAAGGAALLIIGWRLRARQRMYALALQGGGVGLLYLTVFAALRLYALLPPTACFALLVVIAGLSAFLAIGQNSVALAALGATGGFLAPVLASTGQGNHVVLFSFYALLDAGIVAIAWFKAWRTLNLLAFVFTYGIGSGWGVLRYAPENFATTEPF